MNRAQRRYRDGKGYGYPKSLKNKDIMNLLLKPVDNKHPMTRPLSGKKAVKVFQENNEH